MQSEEDLARVVSFAFSRSPKPSFEEEIEKDAKKRRTVRLAAVLRDGDHGFKALLILYPDSPGHGYGTAHRLLGTQVCHESKMGPLGLKTI